MDKLSSNESKLSMKLQHL